MADSISVLRDPAVRAVAAQEVLDGVRGRRSLVIRAVLPVLLFGVVFVTAVVTRGVDQRDEEAYRVAVQGDLDGARETFGLLGARAVLESTDDAARAVSDGATIGVVVPDGLDATRARGDLVTLEVHRNEGDRRSRAALAVLAAAVGDDELGAGIDAVEAAGGAVDRGVGAVDVVDVQLTSAGTRELTGGLAPALLTLQAAMLVSGTATHLLARRRRGPFAAQLLLPLPRWRLALAKTWGEYVVGLLAATPVLVLLLGGVALVIGTRQGLAPAIVDVIGCVAAAAVLSLLAAALGLAVGTVARSQEQVSLLTMAGIVVFAVVAAVFALGTYPPIGPLALIPLVGLVSSLRDLIAGDGSVLWFVVALLSTTLCALGIVRWTGRQFSAERLVLRGAS